MKSFYLIALSLFLVQPALAGKRKSLFDILKPKNVERYECTRDRAFCAGDVVITRARMRGKIRFVHRDGKLSVRIAGVSRKLHRSRIRRNLTTEKMLQNQNQNNQAPIQLPGVTIGQQPKPKTTVSGDLLRHIPPVAEVPQSGLHIEVFNLGVRDPSACTDRRSDYNYGYKTAECFRARVYLDGRPIHVFTTSPGHRRAIGKYAGRGVYTPNHWTNVRISKLSRHHESGAYDQASMPFAIFFKGTGIAFHLSNAVTGRRESGGCLRLRPNDAETLWNLVKSVGQSNVTLTVRDTGKYD